LTNTSTPPALDTAAGIRLHGILTKISRPQGFAGLDNEQRKFLLAALLGSVVPADGKIRPCEIEKLEELLRQRMQTRGQTLNEALDIARSNLRPTGDVTVAATHLPELLSIEDRCNLIGMLWDVALSDNELHSSEEALIYKIADSADVPRKRVIEQQSRSVTNASRAPRVQ
jgi:uncharacterized tellurite resistance protein B-like protein